MNFFRGWEAYRDGFGTLTGEHWLGEGPAACRLGGAGGRLVQTDGCLRLPGLGTPSPLAGAASEGATSGR